MPIRRTNKDPRSPEEQRADASALEAFEAGEFLADPTKEAAGVDRARARARARAEAVAVARRLREIRQALGVTQSDVARLIGTKNTDISRVESGRHVLSLDRLLAIVDALESLSGLSLQALTNVNLTAAAYEGFATPQDCLESWPDDAPYHQVGP